MSIPDWMIDTPSASVDDLATLVARLAHSLRKAAPDNDLPGKAMEYLAKHGIAPSPLREVPSSQAEVQAEPRACGNCFEGKTDFDHICPKCNGSGELSAPQAQPAAEQAEPLMYLNPKVIDPITGKITKGSGGLTHSATKCYGWTVPVYTEPQATKPYSMDQDPQGIRALVAVTIEGAIARGLQGGERPPQGHWLTSFYEIGAKAQPADALDAGDVIADLAYALNMFVGTDPVHSLCQHEGMDAFGRVKGTWSAAAEANARATLKTHAATLAEMAAAQEGGAV